MATDWPPALPRSVFLLDWLSIVFLSGGLRFAARAFREGQLPMQSSRGRRTFLIGAGEAAEMLLRQVRHDSRFAISAVGLIDDNPETHGRSLHGVPVLGGTADLERLVHEHRPCLARFRGCGPVRSVTPAANFSCATAHGNERR